jgi:hypothetical protein
VNQALDCVAVVVEYEHNRIQAQLEQIRERLYGQMEASFPSHEDAALVLSGLLDGFEGSNSGACSIAYATVHGLVIHRRALRQP